MLQEHSFVCKSGQRKEFRRNIEKIFPGKDGYFKLKAVSLAFLALFVQMPMAVAADEWEGNNSNKWTDPGNWASGNIPNNLSNIILNKAGKNSLKIEGVLENYEIGDLVIGNAKKSGELIISNGAGLTVNGFRLGEGAESLGKIVISGKDAKLTVNDRSYLGNNGNSDFLIENGGQLEMLVLPGNPQSIDMGSGAGVSRDTFTVRGQGSMVNMNTWILAAYGSNIPGSQNTSIINVLDGAVLKAEGINVGYSGHGILNIDQATVNLGGMIAAYYEGSSAEINVHGDRARLTSTNWGLAEKGHATLNIYDKAIASVDTFYAGYAPGSIGVINVWGGAKVQGVNSGIGGGAGSFVTVNIEGENSNWSNTEEFDLSILGDSLLNIRQGGSLDVAGGFYIAANAGSNAIANVSGSTSYIHSKTGTFVGSGGHGVLNINQNASVTEDSVVTVAEELGSKGVINIGDGATLGFLKTPVVIGGNGDAYMNFNHQASMEFDAKLQGNLTVSHLNTGTTLLNGVSDYKGETYINAGTLKAGGASVFSYQANYNVGGRGVLDLNNHDQNISNLNNNGLVRFGTNAGTSLSANNFNSNNGVLSLNSTLNDDASKTDILYIRGSSSGTGFITINKQNSVGAETKEGIKIIDVAGVSDAKFSLLSNNSKNGRPAIISGAYAYQLYQGSKSDPGNGNWYLRNTGYGDPVVPYVVYPLALLGLYDLPTLRQRVGNRYWLLDKDAESLKTKEQGAWVRVEHSTTRINPFHATVDNRYSQNISLLQAGVDHTFSEDEKGKKVGGINLQYANGDSKIRSNDFASGKIKSEMWALGLSGTWYGQDGFYMDNQALLGWHSSDISSQTTSGDLVKKNKGLGYTLSSELGKKYRIDDDFAVSPQTQLIFSEARFDQFTDIHGTRVKLDKGKSLRARFGVALDKEWSADQHEKRNVYGVANLNYEFLNGTRVDVGGVQFKNEKDRLWIEFGVGGLYSWNRNKYSVYGELSAAAGFHDPGSSHTLKAIVGFRASF
jgi:fibronectin-binding autotransporter adhesin